MDRIAALPTPGHTFDPASPIYWDAAALHGEIERAFDICEMCRMCFSLCPSFPTLFELVDGHEGEVKALTAGEVERVVDLCWQCKVCYVKCPYTPDDNHEFQLDFPRLLTRYVAQRARRDGRGLASRMFANPERVGRLGTLLPALANAASRNGLNRLLMEKTVGIHRDKALPPFAAERFSTWLGSHPEALPREAVNGKVALFHTCVVESNFPRVGQAALEVLARNRVAVTVPDQRCCGMPALEQGDMEGALARARFNVAALLPLVRSGHLVIALEPTCSYTLRKEYPVLLGTPEAREVAAAVRDVHEYLWELKGAGTLDRSFASTPGAIAYHVPCHLKAQSIGFRSRDVMKLIPGASVKLVDACSCHDGSWAMRTANFPLSLQWGKKAFEALKEAGAATYATDCSLAAMQFHQATGLHPMHPIEVIARAYRADGFPTPVPAAPRESPAPPAP
jgi:glycerol-3-phosphate dehydrogenase subunit C